MAVDSNQGQTRPDVALEVTGFVWICVCVRVCVCVGVVIIQREKVKLLRYVHL